MGTRLSDRHAAPHGDGPGHDEETRVCTAEGLPGPAATTPGATTPIAMPQDPVPQEERRRRIGRHFGQPGDPRRPISPAWLGLEAATTAIPDRRPSHNDA